MIVDNTLVLSDGQAITATAASTNVVDTGALGTPFGSPVALTADIGKEMRIPIAVNVTQAFNNLTTLAVALQGATDAAFTTPKEIATHTYALADLTVGQLDFPAQLPVGSKYRFLRLNYTVVGTAPSTGAIFAAFVAARQSNDH